MPARKSRDSVAQSMPTAVVETPVETPLKVVEVVTAEVPVVEKKVRKPRQPKAVPVETPVEAAPVENLTETVVTDAVEQREPVSKTPKCYRILLESITPAIDPKLLAGKEQKAERKTEYQGGKFKGNHPKQAATKVANRIANVLSVMDTIDNSQQFNFSFHISEIPRGRKEDAKVKVYQYNAVSTPKSEAQTIKRKSDSYEIDREGTVKKYSSEKFKGMTPQNVTENKAFRALVNTSLESQTPETVDKNTVRYTVSGVTGVYNNDIVNVTDKVIVTRKTVSYDVLRTISVNANAREVEATA